MRWQPFTAVWGIAMSMPLFLPHWPAAYGIPTRVVAGVTLHQDRFYYHAWNEVCIDANWISLDTTKDQIPSDLTHIRLVSGDLEEQVRIGALIGKLQIEIMP